MLGQSGLLTLLGMCVVFSFIIILIICMTIMKAVIHALKLDKEEPAKTPVASAPAASAAGNDGAVIAQLGTPDMRLPIQYALYYPRRVYLKGDRLDFSTLTEITFSKPDHDTFLGLKYAYKAIECGGSMPTVLNAANEYAVAKFLDKKIRFLEIYEMIDYCMSCHRFYGLDTILRAEPIPRCPVCGDVIKPDVVLYEEPLDEKVWKGAVKVISESDCMIIVGTSLTVYPAASFVRYYSGNKLVLINKQRTDYDSVADLVINEDVVSVVEQVQKLLF